jgi:hypothetical protein
MCDRPKDGGRRGPTERVGPVGRNVLRCRRPDGLGGGRNPSTCGSIRGPSRSPAWGPPCELAATRPRRAVGGEPRAPEVHSPEDFLPPLIVRRGGPGEPREGSAAIVGLAGRRTARARPGGPGPTARFTRSIGLIQEEVGLDDIVSDPARFRQIQERLALPEPVTAALTRGGRPYLIFYETDWTAGRRASLGSPG